MFNGKTFSLDMLLVSMDQSVSVLRKHSCAESLGHSKCYVTLILIKYG